MSSTFSYQRRVAYCDTDAMAVVHHSNYLRYFEEARVAWLRAHDMTAHHAPHVPFTLGVLESRCYHKKPAYFDDLLEIRVEVRREGLRIEFQYGIFSQRFAQAIATGYTLHVPIDDQLKVCRLTQPWLDALENETWTETWLSNS